MKRRSRAVREPIKGPRRKTPEPTRRSAPKAATRLGLSAGLDETEVAQLIRERDEALEQQTATSEVLRVISASRGELEPIFRAMLERAIRICEAKFGALNRFDGNTFHLAAQVGASRELAEFRSRRGPFKPTPGGLLDRVMRTKEVNFVADITTEPSGPATKLGKARSVVCVPMLRDDALIGVITIYRQEVRPFTGKQIELVQNFAAQAVIAIENARLLNELRQRTNDLTERTVDLTEALEQQTATSEVLQAISSSPGEVEQVFTAMLEKAVRICDAAFGNIFRWDGSTLQLVAGHKTPPAFAEARRQLPVETAPNGPIGRMIRTKAAVHIADLARDQLYLERSLPALTAAVELGGVRTLLVVPLLKEREPIGAFALSRQEVRPFTDKQIELVQNFAAQAVIAIENTRLLNELRERTEEVEKLNKHLEQRVTDQVDEIERMGRLRRFLPPQVADLIVASGSEKQLESHRREITALFCDLRGFTGFTESADAEDVMALLREYHTAIGEIIIKYNGTLERYAGDGVMVIFNDPVPVENPALQAVLMALEVREAIGSLTETWRRWGHELGFGIGIAHGFATLGTIGFEGRFDYAAIGTVSNVASRLCDEARPGQILISPRVLTKVENAVQVEPVGEFELKGIRRPLAAYNVVGAVSSGD
jgi:class 3 adenylate cyclase/DNA-binding FrmR family transcriptional regulator